jgi:hypothetical protein
MFCHLKYGSHGKLLIFLSYECQGIQTKNPFDEILSSSFDFGPLKMNNMSNMNQFCKRLSKRHYSMMSNMLLFIFDGKKLRG